MKTLLLFFVILIICLPVYSQDDNSYKEKKLTNKPSITNNQILVLGTFHFQHHNFDKYPQTMESIKKRLLKYKPDIICVEWLPSLEKNDFYNHNYSEKISELSIETGISQNEAKNLVCDIIPKLKKEPTNILQHIILANAFFISRDYINACYQWYLIDCYKRDLSSDELIKIEQSLPKKIDIYKEVIQGHEIAVLIFPIAKQLNIERLYSVDCMPDRQSMINHLQIFIEDFKKTYGYDPIAESEIIKYFEKFQNDWLEQDNKNGTSTYLEKLNSEEYSRRLQTTYYDLYFSYRYNEDFRIFYELNAEKRNWGIFDLILAAMQANSGNRVLVILGKDHKPFIESYFREWNKMKLVQFSDL
jgi:hypothetical protein